MGHVAISIGDWWPVAFLEGLGVVEDVTRGGGGCRVAVSVPTVDILTRKKNAGCVIG